MRFVVDQLLRVTAPGCNVAIHVQQLLAYKNQHGFIGRRDFRGAMIKVFSAGGFNFVGEFAIQKNPQAMAQRLNLHSLMFITGKRNARNLAPCPNDYVLIFKKPGECEIPVPAIYDSEKNPGGWITTEEWIRDAHGIWTDIQEIDVLDGARQVRESDQEKHVCVARGCLVLTRDGHKPIENVEVGEMVLTHKGRWRPVLAKACNGVREVIQTEAQGVPHLLTTPDHRLWTRSCAGRGGGPGNRWKPGSLSASSQRRRAMTAEPAWVEARSTKGSYINLPLPPVEQTDYSQAEWWLVGRWLGDGHFDSRGRVHITCAKDETAELLELLGKRAGAVTQRGSVSQVAINDRDGRIRSILSRCGRGCDGKKLPAEALALENSFAEALLAGYLSADGHYVAKYRRWTASSVSRPLLLGMAMVAQRARGVVASVYAGRPAGSCKIEGRTMSTLPAWVLSIPPKNLSGMMLDDGGWKKVRQVEAVGEAEVWDLQVAEDHSFIAEGCAVHNCPLQLEVIRRLIMLYTNPGEIVLDPFIGIGSAAFVALGGVSPLTGKSIDKPRRVIGFELKESYHRSALLNAQRAISAAETKAAQSDLFSASPPEPVQEPSGDEIDLERFVGEGGRDAEEVAA